MLKADTVNISVVGLTQVIIVDCIVKTGIKNSESFFFFLIVSFRGFCRLGEGTTTGTSRIRSGDRIRETR